MIAVGLLQEPEAQAKLSPASAGGGQARTMSKRKRGMGEKGKEGKEMGFF